MRIGIDNISTGLSTGRSTIGGMRHYLSDLLTWLSREAPQHELILFQPTWADRLDLDSDVRVEVRRCRGVPGWRPGRVFYEQAAYSRIVNRSGVDVFLATNNILPGQLRTPSVLVMQSLQYFDYPEVYSAGAGVYLRTWALRSLRKAAKVIVLSAASRDIVCARAGVTEDEVRVIYHAIPSHVAIADAKSSGAPIPESIARVVGTRPYILSVSSFYWQKNLARLIEGFAVAKKRHALPHVLILAGQATAKVTRENLEGVARGCGVDDSVVFAGFVPDAVVPILYRNAAASAMVSLSETFGLPVLEAMSLACPVVTSNRGAMSEVAGDAAVLVDPYDINSIATGIAQTVLDEEARRAMVARGIDRARAFSQERRAKCYLDVLEEVAHA